MRLVRRESEVVSAEAATAGAAGENVVGVPAEAGVVAGAAVGDSTGPM